MDIEIYHAPETKFSGHFGLDFEIYHAQKLYFLLVRSLLLTFLKAYIGWPLWS